MPLRTGLATDTSGNRFCAAIMNAEEAFRRCFMNRDRPAGAKQAERLIADAGLDALRGIHVPVPSIVIKDLQSIGSGKGGLYTAGCFSPFSWKIEIPIELAHSVCAQLGIDDSARMHHGKLRDDPNQIVRHVMAAYASTVIHECRHCEQVHRVAKYAFARGVKERKEWDPASDVNGYLDFYLKTFADRSQTWRKPTAPPGKPAISGILLQYLGGPKQLPLNPDERAEAVAWYHSMYGDQSASEQGKRGTSELNTYKSIPEEADAYALQDFVENILYIDWKLNWDDKARYQLAHLNLADAGS